MIVFWRPAQRCLLANTDLLPSFPVRKPSRMYSLPCFSFKMTVLLAARWKARSYIFLGAIPLVKIEQLWLVFVLSWVNKCNYAGYMVIKRQCWENLRRLCSLLSRNLMIKTSRWKCSVQPRYSTGHRASPRNPGRLWSYVRISGKHRIELNGRDGL